MQIRNHPGLKRPEKMRAPADKRDTTRYCNYHQDHGHETEDCVSLQIEIEKMIRGGKLARFVAANRHLKDDGVRNERRYNDDRRDPQGGSEYRERRDDRRDDCEKRRGDDCRTRRRTEPPRGRTPVGEIHTIAGGSLLEGHPVQEGEPMSGDCLRRRSCRSSDLLRPAEQNPKL
jgi:hypothetical protein